MGDPDDCVLGSRDHWLGNGADLHALWTHILTREHLLARMGLIHDILDGADQGQRQEAHCFSAFFANRLTYGGTGLLILTAVAYGRSI